MKYSDWLGQPIEVGSPILYAVSNRHYAEVVWAEVLEIIPVPPSIRKLYSDKDRGKPLHQRTVIGTEEYWDYGRTFKLRVQPHYQNSDFRSGDASFSSRGIDSEWHRDRAPGERAFTYKRVLPKPVTIQNVEKVVVFPLPDGVRDRLERLLDEAIDKANKR